MQSSLPPTLREDPKQLGKWSQEGLQSSSRTPPPPFCPNLPVLGCLFSRTSPQVSPQPPEGPQFLSRVKWGQLRVGGERLISSSLPALPDGGRPGPSEREWPLQERTRG